MLFLSFTDSLISLSSEKLYRKRSDTFIISPIQGKSNSEHIFMDKRNLNEPKQIFPRREICQACFQRQNLFDNEHQRLLRAYEENRKLVEQLRLVTESNQQYQEENMKLKNHLMKMNNRLEEYKNNFHQLKQKTTLEKIKPLKQDGDVDQLKRLRHELNVYKQVIAAKRQEEEKNIDYFSHRRWV